MTLSRMNNWQGTRRALHEAAQVIGGVRKVVAAPEPNWAHLGLQIMPEGVTTGALPGIGTLTLNFPQAAVIHTLADGTTRTFPLAGHSQLELADQIDQALSSQRVRLDRG